jgi:steroid 5-alpha reductase family enzyme
MGTLLSSLLFVLLIILIYFTLLYILSTLLKRADIVDIGWGLGFVLVTISLFLKSTQINNVMLLVLTLVTIWGFRLSTHIFLRNKGKKEDFRYLQFKKDWGKSFWWKSYINIFLLQGILMLIISIPITYLFSFPTYSITLLDLLGLGVWIFGFLFEVISDMQLSVFISKKKNRLTDKRILTTGLWSLTRHPNYFGEVVSWWGIWLICISLSYPISFLTIVGPLTITYLILKVSGIPLLEKKYDGDPEWEEYKKRVPIFLPLKLK